MNTPNKEPRKKLNKGTIIYILIQTAIIIGVTVLSIKFPDAFMTIGMVMATSAFMYFVYFWLGMMQHHYRNQDKQQMTIWIIIGVVAVVGTALLLYLWLKQI